MEWVTQNPSVSVLSAIFVVVVVARLWSQFSKEKTGYTSAGVLLSAAELRFFKCLQTVAPADCYVACKVRLADILMVGQQVKPKDQPKAFNRIKSKHADFVLCDTSTFRILGVVELDDRSHQRADRRARDEFFDLSLKSAGLPVLRVRASRDYDLDELRKSVKQTFTSRTTGKLPVLA